jgi:phosphoglycolate phosphatase-like HAD superfamily hydrolase
MPPSTPIAALFDVEGTLIDCVALQLESWRVTLNEALALTDVVACGERVKHGKPDPSLFLACLTRLQITDASLTVAIGDTPYDAKAAGKLGMRSAGVLTGGFCAKALQEGGCDAVFEQVKDVVTLWREHRVRLIR